MLGSTYSREIVTRHVVRWRWLAESSFMRSLSFVCLSVSLSLILSGCRERGSTIATRDACSLLSKAEVESVQEAPIKETKNSKRSDGLFLVCQCFYTATEFSKSVNLALVQKDSNQRNERSPKDFWKEKFGPYNTNDKERKGQENSKRGEEKEKGIPPKKISGLGDDAYWISNRFGGVLYVLKGDAFVSISLGGPDNEEAKVNKSKALAEKALQRL